MDTLQGFQRTHLRGLAHGLRPVVHVGRDGLTDGVLATIDDALASRELIKVKLAAGRDERRTMAATIDARLGSECVGIVGQVAVFFRPHADPEKRRVKLPERA